MKRSLHRRALWPARAACLGLLCAALSTAPGVDAQEVGAPLVAPPVTPLRLTASAADNAYREWQGALLMRPRLPPVAAGHLTVEVVDLMLGPGQHGKPFRWPQAALLEVRSGEGSLLRGDERQVLRMGAVITLDEGQRAEFANVRKDEALILRATLVGTGAR